MRNKIELKTWASKQALSILSVDNIKVDDIGLDLLKRREDGLISYEDAHNEIKKQALAFVQKSMKMKI